MQRIFGALAIFCGWLCIPLSAILGLIATQFMGLDHVEGELPPSGLYGVPAMTVLWIAVAAAVLTAVPVAAAMFAADPRRRLNIAAAVMCATGVVLLPDDLGRAYAAALIPGAALFAVGGWWVHQAGAIGAEADSRVRTDTEATEPAAGPAPDPPDPAQAAGLSSAADPAVSAAVPGKPSTRRPMRAAPKSRAAADAECPWCSARIAAGAERCPSCGAALTSPTESTADAIPGVTAVAPELRAYQERVAHQKKRPGLLSMILSQPDDQIFASSGERVDPGVLRPPSAEVRAEMERLDREIAAGTIVGEGAVAPETAAVPEAGPPADLPPASDS